MSKKRGHGARVKRMSHVTNSIYGVRSGYRYNYQLFTKRNSYMRYVMPSLTGIHRLYDPTNFFLHHEGQSLDS